MAAKEVSCETEEFRFLTLEEIEQLPVFPEPTTGLVQTDGAGEGYVYLIEEISDTAPKNFKVGQTVNPGTRLSNLQTGNPGELKMHPVYVNNMDAAEKDLLDSLSNYRSTRGGGREWFTVRTDQVATFKRSFTRVANKYRV